MRAVFDERDRHSTTSRNVPNHISRNRTFEMIKAGVLNLSSQDSQRGVALQQQVSGNLFIIRTDDRCLKVLVTKGR